MGLGRASLAGKARTRGGAEKNEEWEWGEDKIQAQEEKGSFGIRGEGSKKKAGIIAAATVNTPATAFVEARNVDKGKKILLDL